MVRQLFLCLACWSSAVSVSLGAAPHADWFPKAPPLPKPTGNVIHVSDVGQLFQAAKDVKPGGTISVADGHYMMPRYFEITTSDVTLRSTSGNRDAVILDGASSSHGELIGISQCQGVTIADLTVQNVKYNGIKINSDRGAQRVTVRNCVIHNVWQRGVKAPGLRKDAERLSPRDCRVQFCLFYNDRAKQFADDPTDTPKTFNGNYIGGIDVKNTFDWKITDNVFLGIQGRTREGRGCIYISEDGRGCVIERNTFLDSDIAIALGNPSLEIAQHHAVDCIVRNNFIANCPETGILACYTSNCQITGNMVFDPDARLRRLIWVQNTNGGLRVANNVLVGADVKVTSSSEIVQQHNVVHDSLDKSLRDGSSNSGQRAIPQAKWKEVIEFPVSLKAAAQEKQQALTKVGEQSPEVIAAMRKVHDGFQGQSGYVAQFGDSITYSMAFWAALGWASPDDYLTVDDGLPRKPAKKRWRDYFQGTRDKGPKFANYSGWTVGQLSKAMDSVLATKKPEFAIVMIGTNDISSGKVPAAYAETLRQVVQKCLDANCIPILNTIPPRRNRDDAVEQANSIIRKLAQDMNIPLADFHAECLRLRPNQSWDGTVISKDGVHPSGGKTHVYTEENLKNCGYALRNWVNFLVLRQLYFGVIETER